MVSPVRVLIPIDTEEAEAWVLALNYAEQLAKSARASDVVLLTHTKDQLRHGTLANFLGGPTAKALAAGRTATLGPTATLRHGTLATLRHLPGKAVIIAYYADARLLDFVDGMDRVAGVIAVPWLPDGADLWRERWAPIVHGEAKEEPATILDDPVVEAALVSVSRMSNQSYSVLHPQDKIWADEALRILRANGHVLHPSKIRNWAIRNGWKPGAADELAKLATKIAGLKSKPRLSGIHNADGRYARWKAGEAP